MTANCGTLSATSLVTTRIKIGGDSADRVLGQGRDGQADGAERGHGRGHVQGHEQHPQQPGGQRHGGPGQQRHRPDREQHRADDQRGRATR